jgi:ankyrin repeat protein
MLTALDPDSGTLNEALVPRINDALAIEDAGTLNLCRAIVADDRSEIARLIHSVGVDLSRNEHVLLPCEHGITGHSVSPLTVAVANGNIEVIRMLADEGADIHGFGNGLGSLTYYAVFSETKNRHAVLRVLLDLGASPDGWLGLQGPYVNQKTPLMWAVERGDYEMAKILIQAGARPNLLESGDGCTALRLAVSRGDEQVVAHLLETGAAVTYRYWERFSEEPKYVSLIEEASALGNHEIARLLIQAQLSRAASGEVQATPIQIALQVLAERVTTLLSTRTNADEPHFRFACDELNNPSVHVGFERESTALVLSEFLTATLRKDEATQMHYVRLGRNRLEHILPVSEVVSSFIDLFTSHEQLRTQWTVAP